MGATASLSMLFKSGDEIVVQDDVYGGTRRYFTRISANQGLTYKFVDFTDLAAVEASISENTKMFWVESPTNPTLKISGICLFVPFSFIDLEAIGKIAHKHNVLLAVDNTFMSSYFQKPLNFGADLVVHSVRSPFSNFLIF